MKKNRFGVLLVLVCMAFAMPLAYMMSSSFAAESVDTPLGRIQILEWTGTTNASGFYQSGESKYVTGWITNVEASCTACTAAWDYEMLNTNGLDRAQGVGANMVSGSTDYTLARTPVNSDGGFQYVHNERVAPKIQNAGSGKAFTIRMTVAY